MSFGPAPGVVLGEKYRLERKLARGGMGSVWLAKHQSLDADVAVKVMSSMIDTPTSRARFEREAKASAQLRSPHIVRVQDYGVQDETPYMVLELLHGEDLGQRLDRVGRLPLVEVAHIASQIAKALSVAHRAGIVHRDLKPSNVFVAEEGGDEVVKLFDFGIARETTSNIVDDSTASGAVLGSPHHMSPEQTRGESVDHRSDIWSFGVVLFRALTGQRPFDGANMPAIMMAVVLGKLPSAREICPELPPDIDRFFERVLNHDPDKRFASAMQMSGALSAIARGEDAEVLLEAPPVDPAIEAVGRDEPTVDVPRTPQGKDSASEVTHSRVLGAVTAGTGAPSTTRTRRSVRLLPWVLGVAAIAGLGFFLGRYQDADPVTATSPSAATEPETSTATTSTAADASTLELAPTTSASASVSAGPSASVMPSARTESPPIVAPVATATLPPPPKPFPPPHPVPPSKPKIDPFTGLPL